MKLIDKSALVAEIERRIKEVSQIEKASYEIGLCDAYKIIISFLDTLEVKEVDLEKDFELTWEDVAWIVNKGFQKCKVESTLTAEDICKDVLKQFKAYKGE